MLVPIQRLLNPDPSPTKAAPIMLMKFEKSRIRGRWFLFRARDAHTMLAPSMFFCSILGLYPCKLDTLGNYTFSKSRYILATAGVLAYVVCLLVVFYHLNISGKLEYDTTTGMLQVNFYLILGGIITIITFALSRPRIRLFQQLVQVSSRLPAETFDQLALWIHVKDIVTFLFLVAHIWNIFSNNAYETLMKGILLYTTMVIFVMDLLYMDCVCILKACFARINESLLNLKQIVSTDEPHLLRRVYHEQKNPLLLIELRALKKQHLLISDVVQSLNMTFGVQLITTVVLTFEEVTFSLYFYIQQTYGNKGINLEKQIWYSYFITSVALYSLKLIGMVWACETGKDQALQIGTNIHEVLVSTSNKQIKDELEIFSLQVLHRDNVFAAKGLNMDATLLTKMAGSITTYLLILIQFLLSYTPEAPAGSCDSSNVQS